MAAFSSLSINDGQVTPVAHSFTTGPQTVLPDGALRFVWFDFSVNGGVAIGANRLQMDVRLPTFGGRKKTRVAGESSQQLSVAHSFILPSLETLNNNTANGISPQPTHAYDTVVWQKVIRNGRAGQQPVKDALAFNRNFSQLAVYTDTVLNYSPPGN